MTQIEFLFFGPPCFRVNGTAVKISRRKAVALAAYLAVTAKPHSREKLATMFWPESDPARSRASLRKALSLITKVLGKSWLDIDRETIGFVPQENLQVDVNRFLELTAMLPRSKGEGEAGQPKADQTGTDQISNRSGRLKRRLISASLLFFRGSFSKMPRILRTGRWNNPNG